MPGKASRPGKGQERSNFEVKSMLPARYDTAGDWPIHWSSSGYSEPDCWRAFPSMIRSLIRSPEKMPAKPSGSTGVQYP